MLANEGEDGLAGAADGIGDQQHRQKHQRAMHQAGQHAGGIVADRESAQHRRPPVFDRGGSGLNGQVRLKARVVKGHADAGNQGDDDQAHQAFEIERVAHVRSGRGGLLGRKEKRIERLVDRIKAPQFAFGPEQLRLLVQ